MKLPDGAVRYEAMPGRSDLDHGLDDVCLVGNTAVHGILNIVQLENVGDDALQIDLACGYGIDRHGVNMAVAENGLEGQFLIQRQAHGQGHFTGLGVTHQNDGGTLLGHINGLPGGDLGACGFDNQIAAGSAGQLQHGFHGIPLGTVDDTVSAQFQRLFQKPRRGEK